MPMITANPTSNPRVVAARVYPAVCSKGLRGGIRLSTIVSTNFSNMMEKEVPAKLAVKSAIMLSPGTRNSVKGTLPKDRPSPSKAKLKMDRNKRAVITGAMKVWR